jgi:hypothetical protein
MKKRPTQSRERVKGGTSSLFVCPLRGQGAERPCGVWGNAPTVPRATNSKEEVNQGAGSEASLPVTLRVLRSAPKLLYPSLAHCRVKWTRPRSLTSEHSCSFPNAGDFASAEASRGLCARPRHPFAVHPHTPWLLSQIFSLCTSGITSFVRCCLNHQFHQ